ncbi:hypothetical protein MO973_04100 [Paenibacillus sp. TRM 82003]|uniref:hypothetical protein n=1 Tax=Kineococcus sp. TRM81007 TaxID=2925831 RepID=UPI001F560826|nr:hypothetical protein [Kineococcus sp. TRM81007]MCI2237229.1 hypothetical protein [Kineococcus sp. TRM81007]MCI3919411.1 hypothetical protein [Paenibacillus sp. TRM 82003]
MSMEGLQAAADPAVGDWIAPRLCGDFGAVCRTVPRGYPAYARILHPVEPDAGDQAGPTTWAGVCARTGRTPHALMQWEAITTPAPPPRSGREVVLSREGRWDEVQVRRGILLPQALGPLLDVLAPFTGEQDCHHALWEGWGWLTGGSAFLTFSSAGGPQSPAPPRAATPDVLEQALNASRLSLPGREYLLFTGPLHAALGMGDQVTDDWFDPQSPNLLWPADRSWCLATEIDFDSTLIAGPVDLIDAVLAAPALEAWPVHEDDDLSAFADHLNT